MVKLEDLTGQKFGKLTVIERVIKEGKYKGTFWKCLCDCGNTIEVTTGRLKTGNTKSCGCITREKVRNIIGERFGKLTVKEFKYRDDNGDGYYLCKCDCGNEKIMKRTCLLSGSSKSCGCLRKETAQQRWDKLIGQKFGSLTVIAMAEGRSKRGATLWLCKCACGNEVIVSQCNLTNTDSCGCINRVIRGKIEEKHGLSKTRLCSVLSGIKGRCRNKNNPGYKNYGERGIKVCDEWDSLTVFYNWAVNNGYREDLFIDRIDNNGNYCPENCRWVTRKENNRNKRNNTLVSFDGKEQCVSAWAEEKEINVNTLISRLKSNSNLEEALCSSVRSKYARKRNEE